MGLLADKIGEKIVILIALFFTFAGNMAYFLTGMYSESQHHSTGIALIYISRIVAGLGSAGLVIVLRYMVASAGSDPAEHVKVMNNFRTTGLISRVISPSIATIFLYTPDSHIGKVSLNYATIPVLITMCLALIVCICTIFLFRDRPRGETSASFLFWREHEMRSISKRVILINIILTLLLSGVWALMSQLIPICLFVYEIIHDIETLWYPYIPLIVGSLLSSIVLKRFMFDEFYLLIASLLGLCIATVFLVPFSAHPSQWLFYVGAAFFFLFNTSSQTILRGMYSRMIGISRYIGILLSLLFISNGVAQLIGSSIAGALVSPRLSSTWFLRHNCSLQDFGNFTCANSLNPITCTSNCTIQPCQWASGEWILDCYVLKGYAGVIGFSFACSVAGLLGLLLARKKLYPPSTTSVSQSVSQLN